MVSQFEAHCVYGVSQARIEGGFLACSRFTLVEIDEDLGRSIRGDAGDARVVAIGVVDCVEITGGASGGSGWFDGRGVGRRGLTRFGMRVEGECCDGSIGSDFSDRSATEIGDDEVVVFVPG